ncbi:MAG TPA: class I SAM-dependent methyltransferase [Luteibaculaceae bacterium]|nr:class I SAM-dependent methyltransferase [Luteibaculaceae bacterium]
MIEDVLRTSSTPSWQRELRALRDRLKEDLTIIPQLALGAGSKNPKPAKTVSTLLSEATQKERYQHFFYRLAQWNKSTKILELGTQLGVTTWVFAQAVGPEGRVVSIEGNPAMMAKARTLLDQWSQVELLEGSFDEVLPDLLQAERFDLIYIDGNHTYEATVRYFDWLVASQRGEGVLIFDDINWSAEMQRAWRYIENHPQAYYTVDLFQVGLVFLSPQLKKQSFCLQF